MCCSGRQCSLVLPHTFPAFLTADFDVGICDILCDGARPHCGSDGSDLDLPLDSAPGPPCSSDLGPPCSGSLPSSAASLSFHAMSAPGPSALGFAASLSPPSRSISMPSLAYAAGEAAPADCDCGNGGGGYEEPAAMGAGGCDATLWELPGCMADGAAMELEAELAGLLQTFVAE